MGNPLGGLVYSNGLPSAKDNTTLLQAVEWNKYAHSLKKLRIRLTSNKQLCWIRGLLHQALRPDGYLTQLLPKVCSSHCIHHSADQKKNFSALSIFWDVPTTCPRRTPMASSPAATVTFRMSLAFIPPTVKVSPLADRKSTRL